ncbi:hypothetical protein [Neobacillus massiliamazoniensis]|uniref:Uncharacterized protein n=1 Tax=Neobacillus massiliamazoniensis TaxID=1499688 RepID=A0A0U1NZJ3_9BACI|nr:hypothetical protein [Neobacillus massiliamazoniensis]CRK83431.1 hypothetical protein BN000_03399 [Neobacillus massiliamazoniensis]
MEKFHLYTLQNVKHTLLAFGDNMEIFRLYTRPDHYLAQNIAEIKERNRPGIPEQDPFCQLILSKGAREKKHPLPIVNALSKELFKELKIDPKKFLPGNHNKDELALTIIKNAYISVGIDYDLAFWKMEDYFYSSKMKIKFKKGELSFMREIFAVIDYALSNSPGEPQINFEFSELKVKYDQFFEKKYGESYSFNLEALMFRVASTEFTPAFIVETTVKSDADVADKIDEESNPDDDENNPDKERKWFKKKEMIPIQAAYTDNPFGYAWLELYFSEISKTKFSICTFCGETFSLQGKRGNGLNKSVCGKEKCKKELRRQNDERKRLINPEEVTKKALIRKHKSLAYKEIVVQKKTNVTDFAQRHGYPSNEVEKWIADRKIKENQKEKRQKNK